MNPDMVYQYPIWAVGVLLVCAAVLCAVLLELCARRLLPIELRRRHNDVAAAILSIIGVTYAVPLAFRRHARMGRFQPGESGQL
jgi:hypothetical protein